MTVDESLGGARLIDFLERSWPGADRAFLRRLAREERVTVNRIAVGLRHRLHAGDHVVLDPPGGSIPEFRPRAQAPDLSVLAESEHCLVVDKPHGLPSVPDRAGRGPSVHGLLSILRPELDLRIAHRLDRDTSGCLCLAVGLEGARRLDRAFRAGRVAKEYLALVEGRLRADSFEVRAALGPDRRRPGMVLPVADGSKRSRPAHTRVEVVERFRHFTLVRLIPTTGRGHQVRVHMMSTGHPIVADGAYGAKPTLALSDFKRPYKHRRGAIEVPLLTRTFLHASRLEVPAEASAPAVSAQSGLPDDLRIALMKLRRFDSTEETCA